MAMEHWKTRRIPQVKWIIDEIYNKLAGKAINATRLIKLGDELDKEGLLHMSPPWKTVKEGRMTTREMFQSFKNQSLKSFTTREIYVRWLDDRDRIECRSIRDAEMNFILDNLRIRKKFCTMEWLNSKGMIAKDTGSDDMFHTLSFAFAETPLAIKQIIRDEMAQTTTMQYKAFDKTDWTTNPVFWDPLVFYVCANKFKCIVSIQADETEEYRIYPDIFPVELIVTFGQLNQSKFVYLKSNRRLFDAMDVTGIFCGKKDCTDCTGMEKHLQSQLGKLNHYTGKITERSEKPKGKHLMNQHTKAVDGLLAKSKETNKELDKKDKVLGDMKEVFDEYSDVVEKSVTFRATLQKMFRSIDIKPRPGEKQRKKKADEEVTDSDVIDNTNGNTVQVKCSPSPLSRISERLTDVEDTPKPQSDQLVDNAFHKLL